MLKKILKQNMGTSNLGWLESRFHFSFAHYHNPNNMGFGVLRVINDDIIHPKSGFDMHPHKDMEIISYIVDGEITHKDSMGNEETLKRGEVQYISAGDGIFHSEYNKHQNEDLRLLQIWLLPPHTILTISIFIYFLILYQTIVLITSDSLCKFYRDSFVYFIDPKIKKPLHIQLCEAIKEDIISNLKIGDKLPSIRKISDLYHLSKNTVECSYSQLCAEGYIHSRPRSGYFVSNSSFEKYDTNKTSDISTKKTIKTYRHDFFPARLPKDSFPIKIWKRLFNKAVDEELDMGGYCDDYGEMGLRVQITRYLLSSRGVNCDPDQVIVCTGFMDAIELLAKTIKHKYSSFAIEHPGYHIARRAFENFGYSIDKINIDKNGLLINELQQSNSRVVYITPSHQYPTGVTMPVSNRAKLLEWAKEVDGLIIEDDYDSEMSYKNRPIPSLQGLDRYDKVVYFGTFAKFLSHL